MLVKILATNFLSWADLDFTIPQNITAIDGWNENDQTNEGSGKSGIFNAISWGAYGKLPKDTKIDDVIRTGERGCSTALIFDDVLGTEIHRTRNPNDLWLVQNGAEIRGKDAKETQTLIQKWLGISFDVFCQANYFAQNYDFKFLTSNQEARGVTFSEIQDLKVFDSAREKTHGMIKTEERGLLQLQHDAQLKAQEIVTAEKDVELEKAHIAAVKTKRDTDIAQLGNWIIAEEAQIRFRVEQKLSAIALLEKGIAAEKLVISGFREKHDATIKVKLDQIADLEKAAGEKMAGVAEVMALLDSIEIRDTSSLEAHLKELQAQIWDNQTQLKNVDRTLRERKFKQDRGETLGAKYQSLGGKIEELQAFIANPGENVCPTCKSVLGAGDTTHAQNEITEKVSERAAILAELGEIAEFLAGENPTKVYLEAKIEETRTFMAQFEEAIKAEKAKETQKRDYERDITQANIAIADLDYQIVEKQATVAVLKKTEIPQTSPALENLEKLLAEKRAELQFPDNAQLQVLHGRLEKLKAAPLDYDPQKLPLLILGVKDLQNTVANLGQLAEEKRVYIGRLETLKEGFREVKAHVFNSLLNELNARVGQYLGRLFEVPVSLRFTNEDLKIGHQILLDGEERSLGLLSGGQLRRFILASDLALSDIILARKGSKFGFTIWDEVMKGLSGPSMERVVGIFRDRKEPVLAVEHNDSFKQIVQNNVKVVSRNGISRFENS